MADRPIQFSGPMVRALLSGTKTQTRRIIKPRKHASIFDGSWDDSYVLDPGNSDWRAQELRYAVGDRLYVREHWRTGGQFDHLAPRDIPRDWAEPIAYCADEPPGQILRAGRFRQGMHMPRWASRITLTVTDVRVERLQDISEEDAVAEGVPADYLEHIHGPGGYRDVWEAINGPDSWAANPWVAAYTFTVALQNIDQETNHVEG